MATIDELMSDLPSKADVHSWGEVSSGRQPVCRRSLAGWLKMDAKNSRRRSGWRARLFSTPPPGQTKKEAGEPTSFPINVFKLAAAARLLAVKGRLARASRAASLCRNDGAKQRERRQCKNQMFHLVFPLIARPGHPESHIQVPAVSYLPHCTRT
jgi:hypothetical protein